MKLDHNKEYVYRNGEKPWKIIWDVPGEIFPIVSINNFGTIIHHRPDGTSMRSGSQLTCINLDLIEVKLK